MIEPEPGPGSRPGSPARQIAVHDIGGSDPTPLAGGGTDAPSACSIEGASPRTVDGAAPPASSSSEGNPAYALVDASRAVLASIVAFSHAWYLIVRDYQPGDGVIAGAGYFLAGFAHACVIIFFVLSGYWITRTVDRRLRDGWSWRHYLADRLVRLDLVLVPALVLGGTLDAIGYYVLQTPTHLAQTGTFVLRADLASTLRPEIFLGNLAFLQGVLLLPFGSNGPLWSVGYEFWYYLWFPALALSVRQRRPSWSLLLVIIGLWSAPFAMGFLAWLCGTAAYVAERRWSPVRASDRPPPLRIVAVAAVGVGVVLLIVRFRDFPFEDFLLAAVFGILLTLLLMARVGLPPLMTALARFGARSSFTLYATHFPVLALFAGLMLNDERLEPSFMAALSVTASLIATVAIAVVLSRFTERQTAEVRRRLSALVTS